MSKNSLKITKVKKVVNKSSSREVRLFISFTLFLKILLLFFIKVNYYDLIVKIYY